MNKQSMHKGRRVFVTFILATTLALTRAFGQGAVVRSLASIGHPQLTPANRQVVPVNN